MTGKRDLPYDRAVRTGTFVRGTKVVYSRVEIGAIPSAGRRAPAHPARPPERCRRRASRDDRSRTEHGHGYWWFAHRVRLRAVGRWRIVVDLDGKTLADAPVRRRRDARRDVRIAARTRSPRSSCLRRRRHGTSCSAASRRRSSPRTPTSTSFATAIAGCRREARSRRPECGALRRAPEGRRRGGKTRALHGHAERRPALRADCGRASSASLVRSIRVSRIGSNARNRPRPRRGRDGLMTERRCRCVVPVTLVHAALARRLRRHGEGRRRPRPRHVHRMRARRKLKLSEEDGRIEVEFEVDQNRNGVRWTVMLQSADDACSCARRASRVRRAARSSCGESSPTSRARIASSPVRRARRARSAAPPRRSSSSSVAQRQRHEQRQHDPDAERERDRDDREAARLILRRAAAAARPLRQSSREGLRDGEPYAPARERRSAEDEPRDQEADGDADRSHEQRDPPLPRRSRSRVARSRAPPG